MNCAGTRNCSAHGVCVSASVGCVCDSDYVLFDCSLGPITASNQSAYQAVRWLLFALNFVSVLLVLWRIVVLAQSKMPTRREGGRSEWCSAVLFDVRIQVLCCLALSCGLDTFAFLLSSDLAAFYNVRGGSLLWTLAVAGGAAGGTLPVVRAAQPVSDCPVVQGV